MIDRLTLHNFRCFRETAIDFKRLSVVVGKNNAGKSTLIEALRIVSAVTNRATRINYTRVPDWLTLREELFGITPSIDNLDISSKNIIHLYGAPPAKIVAYFHNKCRVEVYLGTDAKVFALLFDPANRNVGSKGFAVNLKLPAMSILPQISPLLRDEKIIRYRTVQKNVDTNLSSRNFRNQLKYFGQHFGRFKEIAEGTWNGLALDALDVGSGLEGEALSLIVRDNNFASEIGWMGHGLQMWLQTMWFLAGCAKDSTVILDEPDVYMHADLQRKLIRFVKDRFSQVMIATHSVEIMSEVDAEAILPVDSSKELITYANNAPIVQEIVERIGSIHNIEIARLFSRKKFLIVEGDADDVKILGIFQATMFPNSSEPLDIIPKTFIEGWGGWQRVIGSVKVFRDNEMTMKTYCVLDSDYHLEEDKLERYRQAEINDLNLHIWRRKEIENYLLVSNAIYRIIEKERRTTTSVELRVVEDKLIELIEALKDESIQNFGSEITAKDRSKSFKTCLIEAKLVYEAKHRMDHFSAVSGKAMISRLSKWTSETFHVNLNPFKIAREIRKTEIHPEPAAVIQSIERRANFGRG